MRKNINTVLLFGKLSLFLLLGSMCSKALYAVESYAVERTDGGVSIVNYFEGSNDTLDDVLRDIGLSGRPIERISKADMPADRTDRNFWKLSGKKVVVDTVKKQAALDAKAQKDAEADSVLSKLKISRQEAQKLKEVISGL